MACLAQASSAVLCVCSAPVTHLKMPCWRQMRLKTESETPTRLQASWEGRWNLLGRRGGRGRARWAGWCRQAPPPSTTRAVRARPGLLQHSVQESGESRPRPAAPASTRPPLAPPPARAGVCAHHGSSCSRVISLARTPCRQGGEAKISQAPGAGELVQQIPPLHLRHPGLSSSAAYRVAAPVAAQLGLGPLHALRGGSLRAQLQGG